MNVVLVLAVLIISGIVAYVGDVIGKRLGKKRVSLFGLRPRQTAVAIAVTTGCLITGGTILALAVASQDVRQAIFHLRELNEQVAAAEARAVDAQRGRDEAEASLQQTQTDLDEALMEEMASTEVWVSPTVNGGWGRRLLDERGEPSDFFERLSRSLRAQRQHGVRFIASTDAGIPGVAHPKLLDGLLAFERYADLAPVDVLRAATSEAATALGIADRTGRIAPGLSADFLVLEADPLVDLEALRDPEVVVFRGAWLDRRARGGVESERSHARSV